MLYCILEQFSCWTCMDLLKKGSRWWVHFIQRQPWACHRGGVIPLGTTQWRIIGLWSRQRCENNEDLSGCCLNMPLYEIKESMQLGEAQHLLMHKMNWNSSQFSIQFRAIFNSIQFKFISKNIFPIQFNSFFAKKCPSIQFKFNSWIEFAHHWSQY